MLKCIKFCWYNLHISNACIKLHSFNHSLIHSLPYVHVFPGSPVHGESNWEQTPAVQSHVLSLLHLCSGQRSPPGGLGPVWACRTNPRGRSSCIHLSSGVFFFIKFLSITVKTKVWTSHLSIQICIWLTFWLQNLRTWKKKKTKTF